MQVFYALRNHFAVSNSIAEGGRTTTDLENLIEHREDGTGFSRANICHSTSKRHHCQGRITANDFVGDGVVGRRVGIQIEQVEELDLWSGGFNGLHDVYGPLWTPFRVINRKLHQD